MTRRYKPDFPRIRASCECPTCGGAKPIGNVTCWSCHNECELGTAEQRAGREALLVIAEAVS